MNSKEAKKKNSYIQRISANWGFPKKKEKRTGAKEREGRGESVWNEFQLSFFTCILCLEHSLSYLCTNMYKTNFLSNNIKTYLAMLVL
jgi:hypothetical protein